MKGGICTQTCNNDTSNSMTQTHFQYLLLISRLGVPYEFIIHSICGVWLSSLMHQFSSPAVSRNPTTSGTLDQL